MNYLFYLLIFSLPLGVLVRFNIGPNIYLYPYDLAAGAICLFFLVKQIHKPGLVDMKLAVMSVLFVLTGLVSLFINLKHLDTSNFVAALGYLARFTAYLSLMFAVFQLKVDTIRQIPKQLIFAAFLFALAGITQVFIYPSLKSLTIFGWDNHLYRLVSSMLDPNFAGAFLALAFLLVLGTQNFKAPGKKMYLNVLLLAIFLVSIFLTHSRSALVTLIVGGAVFFLLKRQFKLVFGFISICIIGFLSLSDFHVEGLNPFRIVSAEARIESSQDALKIASKNLVLGVGFNAYRSAQVRYGLRSERGASVSNADAGTDNSFLFVFATTGVVGFILYLELWVNIVRKIYQKTKMASDLSKITIASIISIMVNSIFINSLFYPPILAWIMILCGVTLSKKQ